MVWTEIDVARPHDDAELRAALATSFGVADARVLVVSDFAAQVGSLDPAISLVVEHHPQPGDFPERLMIVLWDGKLIDTVGEATSLASYATLSALSFHLDAAIVAPDSGIDPYRALLIRPTGEVLRVALDEAFADDEGGVSIAADPPPMAIPELSYLPRRQMLTS